MARNAIELPIFIASASDAMAERDVIQVVIEQQARKAANHSVFLRVVRWELDSRAGVGRPQALINKLLQKSELFVVIFRERVGTPAAADSPESGTDEELRRALELVDSGRADDVFLYFFKGDSPSATDPMRVKLERIFESRRLFGFGYTDVAQLRERFEAHLDTWLDKWERVPEIVESTLSVSPRDRPAHAYRGEDRLVALKPHLDAIPASCVAQLAAAALDLYTEYGPKGVDYSIRCAGRAVGPLLGLAEQLPENYRVLRQVGLIPLASLPLTRGDLTSLRFSDDEWFYAFCALGIIPQILADNLAPLERRPFINSIHQYLSIFSLSHRGAILQRLVCWLSDRHHPASTRPIVRNFAAYVLGMLNAKEAEDALAAALEDRGQDVATYAIAALGKIRSRRHLDLLVERYHHELDAGLRQMIGQSVCATIGIADYEL